MSLPIIGQESAPTQTGPLRMETSGLEDVGRPCGLCPKAFGLGEDVVRLTTDQGELVAHPACFWRVRAQTFEQMHTAAWQLLCGLVARVGAHRAKVRQAHFEEAAKAGFQMEVVQEPGGTVTLRLATQAAALIVVPRLTGVRQP